MSSYKDTIKDLAYSFQQHWLPDFSELYINPWTAPFSFLKNSFSPRRVRSLDNMRRNKKDILFILGRNRSINDISESTWRQIGQYDTFGTGWWIFHKFVPTYYSWECSPRNEVNEHFKKMIAKKREDYAETTFVVNTKVRRRGMLPQFLPDFFPHNPKVFYLQFPRKLVRCPLDRPFAKEDFTDAFMYRNSMNLHLLFARLLGYKKIVLAGCEMDTGVTFHQDYPEAQFNFELPGYSPSKKDLKKMDYVSQSPPKNKHDIIETIHAINKFVFKEEGIELFVFNPKSRLYPKVPLFEF